MFLPWNFAFTSKAKIFDQIKPSTFNLIKSANITHFTFNFSIKFQTENEILDTIPENKRISTSFFSEFQLVNGALCWRRSAHMQIRLPGIKPSRRRYFLFSRFVIKNIPNKFTFKSIQFILLKYQKLRHINAENKVKHTQILQDNTEIQMASSQRRWVGLDWNCQKRPGFFKWARPCSMCANY